MPVSCSWRSCHEQAFYRWQDQSAVKQATCFYHKGNYQARSLRQNRNAPSFCLHTVVFSREAQRRRIDGCCLRELHNPCPSQRNCKLCFQGLAQWAYGFFGEQNRFLIRLRSVPSAGVCCLAKKHLRAFLPGRNGKRSLSPSCFDTACSKVFSLVCYLLA